MTQQQSTPERRAQVIYTDAATLAATIHQAERNLTAAEGGYPTGLEGSGADPASSTERAALNPPDAATRDKAALHKALKAAETAVRAAAVISHRWGTWNVTGANTAAAKLAAIDQDLWCKNCVQHGHKNPKALDRTECDYCATFRNEYKRACPKDVLDLRATKGRIYVQDIQRILTRIDTEAKARRKAERDAAKAAAKTEQPVNNTDAA